MLRPYVAFTRYNSFSDPCVKYLLLYKPFEVMSAFTDPDGRKTLADFVTVKDVYAAGRLDYDSEGLLLLTDDGETIHRLTDPKFDHAKTYLAQVEGIATEAQLNQLRAGVELKEGLMKPTAADILKDAPTVPFRKVRDYHPTTWLQVVLREGKKRQLRRMTAAVGLPCLRLVRIGIGPLALGDLQPGQWRTLTPQEEKALLKFVGL
jgi:23S rRNA pseudouridine2457 synthase